MSLSPSIRRRVHSEPTLDYSLLLDASSTPRNGERQVTLSVTQALCYHNAVVAEALQRR